MVCPKCGNPIKRFDLSPNCKKCGVHIMYYTQEQDLARDAKKTELEFARARVITSRMKTAFIKGRLPIMRMVLMVLCIAVLCLPFFTLKIDTPLWQAELSAGAVGVYGMVSSAVYTQLFNLLGAGVAVSAARLTAAVFCLFLVTVLIVGCMLLTWMLSFTNLKSSAKWQCGFACAGAVCAIAAAVLGFAAKSAAADYSFLTASAGAGAFVAAVLFGAFFAVNFILLKSGQPVTIKEVDTMRIDMAKKVKSGEVKLEDLPLPVFETDEERENRVNAMQGVHKSKKDKKKEKEEAQT